MVAMDDADIPVMMWSPCYWVVFSTTRIFHNFHFPFLAFFPPCLVYNLLWYQPCIVRKSQNALFENSQRTLTQFHASFSSLLVHKVFIFIIANKVVFSGVTVYKASGYFGILYWFLDGSKACMPRPGLIARQRLEIVWHIRPHYSRDISLAGQYTFCRRYLCPSEHRVKNTRKSIFAISLVNFLWFNLWL